MRPFRLLVAVLLALGVSTPVAAQFKKLKDAASKAAEQKAAPSAPAPADGGVVVVTPEVVDRLLAGDKAAKAEREKAGRRTPRTAGTSARRRPTMWRSRSARRRRRLGYSGRPRTRSW